MDEIEDGLKYPYQRWFKFTINSPKSLQLLVNVPIAEGLSFIKEMEMRDHSRL